MLETKSARPGAGTTETGMSAQNTGKVYEAHNDYNKFLDGLQGRLALRPKEAAAALGIGNNAIYELCNRSGFPVIQLGNKKLIPVDGLRRWLDAKAKGGEVL